MGEQRNTITEADSLEAILRGVPFFRTLDRLDVARLLGTLIENELPAGTVIFEEGAAADGLYLMIAGRVEVMVKTAAGTQVVNTLSAPAYFGEFGLLLSLRTASARAVTDTRLWKLPRDRFDQLLREKPTIGLALAASTAEALDQIERRLLGAPQQEYPAPALFRPPVRRRPFGRRLTGGILAVAVPLVLWWLPPPTGLSPGGWHVTVLLLGAALAWLLEPVPDFLVALLLVAAWGITAGIPLALSFSGFVSPNWIISMAALALAVAMVRSGLLLRIALRLIGIFPNTHNGNVLALLVSGVLITPLVPLGLARVAAVAPLAKELSQALGYPARSRATASLAFAGLLGYGMFSSVFLSGLAMNFFVYGLLPSAERARFDWVGWLVAAAPAGAVLLIGSCIVVLAVLRPELAPRVRPDTLRQQVRALGRLQGGELVTLAAVGLLLVGFIAQPVTHLDVTWVAVVVLGVVVAGGALNLEAFRTGIDWAFLVFFGTLLGAGAVLHHAGVDSWLGGIVTGASRWLPTPGLIVLGLALFVVLTRLVLPWIPATLLLSVTLVPAAPHFGVASWVVGFVVLVGAITWLVPNQSDFCRLMTAATNGDLFTTRHGALVGAAMTAVTVVGIGVSIPYWQGLGLVGR
jgi:DASS family divalent anion:Na+ symporter